jgi:hypothetical protein
MQDPGMHKDAGTFKEHEGHGRRSGPARCNPH